MHPFQLPITASQPASHGQPASSATHRPWAAAQAGWCPQGLISSWLPQSTPQGVSFLFFSFFQQHKGGEGSQLCSLLHALLAGRLPAVCAVSFLPHTWRYGTEHDPSLLFCAGPMHQQINDFVSALSASSHTLWVQEFLGWGCTIPAHMGLRSCCPPSSPACQEFVFLPGQGCPGCQGCLIWGARGLSVFARQHSAEHAVLWLWLMAAVPRKRSRVRCPQYRIRAV